MIQLSVIIPTYKEAAIIEKQINLVHNRACMPDQVEIIVCDSNHTTPVKDPRVTYVNSDDRGRSLQMNLGASKAGGEILYFLHADTIPPIHFDKIISSFILKGKLAGCFRLKFDYQHPLLQFSSWFTRFKSSWFRGGDQSLFIAKDLFYKLGGFDQSMGIMEDIDIIRRIKKENEFMVPNHYVITSARKYLTNGVYKLQFLFGILHLKYRLGCSQSYMQRFYKKHVTPS